MKFDGVQLLHGDCLERLAELPDGFVQMCVTSPPYYGLRDYGTADWDGGDPDCDHKIPPGEHDQKRAGGDRGDSHTVRFNRDKCHKCGATRIDQQIGLEETPEAYIERLVSVFREVRRVLADDGTLWVNIGDSYVAGATGGLSSKPSLMTGGRANQEAGSKRPSKRPLNGLKPKDLIGIPWALAKALRDPYYTGMIKNESDRVWLAAMMDGEGTISGFYHDRADGGGIRTGLNVCLTNSCMQIIDRAAKIWPASLHPHKQNNERLGTRDVFRWKPNGADNVGNFLAELYPYLMTKKRQAMLGWNLMQFSKDGQLWGKSDRAEEVRQKRAILVRMISALNSGNHVDIPDWVNEPPSLYEPGWYLRQDCIWHKPNPMPESVTDRCTKSHEYIFLLSKSARYFFDSDAIKEPSVGATGGAPRKIHSESAQGAHGQTSCLNTGWDGNSTRNKRSVWTVATRSYSGAHFAVFPEELIEPCILAGTSARGHCPDCGARWERQTEPIINVAHTGTTESAYAEGTTANRLAMLRQAAREQGTEYTGTRRTTGWSPTCDCGLPPVPDIVLDPFNGSGTTGAVAMRHKRHYIGCELNADYLDLTRERLKDVADSMAQLDMFEAEAECAIAPAYMQATFELMEGT